MEAPPPVPEPAQDQSVPANTGLVARLFNVFAVPGDVFDEVKASPFKAGNWVVPVVVSAVIGVLATWLIFSQPGIQQQLREQQEKALALQVQAGKMSQADADRVLDLMSNPLIMKVAGGVGAVVGSAVRAFWWGLVLWLLGRWLLKAQFDFLKGLEVSGLALMIGVLGALIALLLTVYLGRLFATPSLALAITDFDPTRKSHLFAGACNVFSFWQIGVTALGLAKLAGVSFLRAAVVVVTFWCLQESLFIMVGMGTLAL